MWIFFRGVAIISVDKFVRNSFFIPSFFKARTREEPTCMGLWYCLVVQMGVFENVLPQDSLEHSLNYYGSNP